MPKREIIPFQKDHAFQIDYRKGDEFAVDCLVDLADHPLYTAYTGMEDGRVLGVFGFIVLWDGVAEFSLTVSEGVLESPYNPTSRWIHKNALRIVTEFMKKKEFHRIQAVCDLRFGVQRENWLKRLGFEFEGIMRAYTPDKFDCARYALVRT